MSEIDDAMSAEEAAWQQRRSAAPVALPPQDYPYPQQSNPVPFNDQSAQPPVIYTAGWGIITRKISGTWKAGIFHTSYLFENYDASAFSVTGLLTSEKPANSDSGWFTVSAGVEPFLKTVLAVDGTSGVVSLTSASIQHSGFVKTFLHDGGVVVSGDTIYSIASANVKIGKIVTESSGALGARQYFPPGARVMCGLQVVAYKSDGTDPQNIAALYPSPF